MPQASPDPRPSTDTFAALDLGSNSFHMVVARQADGQLVVIDRMKESVQLAAGLDPTKQLTPQAQQRAVDCLHRFGERVRSLPAQNVRAVGTNSLRMARNAEAFLEKAEEALGQPIEIISGIEEARLIYLGVAHGLGPKEGRRLVIDIGGGSTELIIGERDQPLDLESLYVGCVTMTQRHFADGRVSAKRFRRAEVSALQELEGVQERFRRLGWNVAVGSSGTIRSVGAVVKETGWSKTGAITRDALKKVRGAVIAAESIQALEMPGLSAARVGLFPAGVAVLSGIFESLNIDTL